MTARQKKREGEDGFVLISVLFLVVLVLIGLALAAPKIATQIRRDKELELYHRGMQYSRAVRMYYKKFGAYPISLDQLDSTNNIRFLRKRYKDPFTGKADWRLIHLGEAKVPAMGFFGQPLGVAGANGTGSPGISGQPGSTLGGGSPGSNSGGSSPNFGNSFSSGSSTNGGGTTGGSSPTDPSSTSGVGGSPTSGSGFGSTSTGGPAGLGNSTLTSSTGSPIGSTGPIVGVASIAAKESIREFEKQKHYNEWEFVYNPQTDLGGLGGNTGLNNGQGGLQQNNNPFGNTFNNPSGSNTGPGGNPGFGSGNGPGSNNPPAAPPPAAPPPAPPPTQIDSPTQ